jgi:hypothetical protein
MLVSIAELGSTRAGHPGSWSDGQVAGGTPGVLPGSSRGRLSVAESV